MTLPTNYVPRGLVPIVVVSDRDGVEQYRYEHKHAIGQTVASIHGNGNVIDGSGNGNSGTWTGTEKYVAGRVGKAMSFDGSSYVTLANESNFDFTKDTPFSISCWFYPNSGTTSNRMIFTKGNDVFVNAGYYLFYNDGGNQGTNDRVIFYLFDGTTLYNVTTPSGSITLNDWNHIVVTYDGLANRSGIKIYINGSLSATGASLTGIGDVTNLSSPTIGAESDGSRKMNGNSMIQHLNVYDIDLTQAQVTDMYESNKTPTIGTPEQDFPMMGYHLHSGIGADLGRLVITLDDRNNAWTDTTKGRRPSKFMPMWKVDLYLVMAEDAGNPVTGATNTNLPSDRLWFSGFLVDPQVERPITNYQRQTLFAVGVAKELEERLTSFKSTQDRADDGVAMDTTNPLTAAYLLTELLTKTYHFPHTGLPALTNFNTDEVTTSNITFADFHTHFYTIHQAIQEIAQRAGFVWGVRPDRTIYMFPRGTKDSGILLTNNTTANLTNNWDMTNVCITRNVPTGFTDSGGSSGYAFLHGVGGVTDFILYEQTTSDASLNLSVDDEYAFPFLPTEDSISRIALFGDDNGGTDITEDMHVCILSDDGRSVPQTGEVKLTAGASGSVDGITVAGVQIMSGAVSFDTDLETTGAKVAENINNHTSTPNYRATSHLDNAGDAVITIYSLDVQDWTTTKTVTSSTTTITSSDTNMAVSTLGAPSFDLRRRIAIGADLLNEKFTTAGGWLEQPVETLNSGTSLTPYQVHWLVISGNSVARLDYDSTQGVFARNIGTVDNKQWIHDSGALKVRIHHSHSVDIIIENTVARKTFGDREVLLPIHDFPSEDAAVNGLIGFSEATSRAHRIYQPIQAAPPHRPPKLGMTARFIDKFNGMDTFVDLIGYDIQATSYSKWNQGVNSMTFHVEERYHPDA